MTDPSKQSKSIAAMAENWALVDALLGGTAAMRKAGKKYLPQFPKENDAAYKNRLNQAVLFPAFARTASTLAAKPLSRPIGLKGVPKAVERLLHNVDMRGTDLQAFAGQIMRASLGPGLDGVLVDMPPRPEGLQTKADELAAGLRPYMVRYPAPSILGWRAEPSANGAILTELRLLEKVEEAADTFDDRLVEQVRVLTPGTWQLWRKATDQQRGTSGWSMYEAGTTSLDLIPFVFFYGIQEDFGIGKPPLIDLANLNVKHWQSQSDQDNILHIARVPVLFAKGFGEDDEIAIGAATATTTSNLEANLSYVEHSGEAIGAGREAILDLEDQMRQAGAELTTQRPAIATATQVRSEDEGNRSILQEIAENFENSLARCLQLMGVWIGEASAPEVELFKDFASADLSEKGGDLLLRAAKDGHVSSETVFDHLKRMDIISPSKSWSDEQRRLGAEKQASEGADAR